MFIYSITYYLKNHNLACDVYTSDFSTKQKADNFKKKLENSGLDLVIEEGFLQLDQDEKTANFMFEQFKSHYTDF